MENNNLNFEIKEGTLRICIVGEINHHNVIAMRTEIDTKIRELCPKRVLLNLSQVDFMDSSGLGLVLGRYSLAQELGAKLVIEKPNKEVLSFLKLAKVHKVIKIKK